MKISSISVISGKVLLSQVGIAQQRVIDSISEIGHAHCERQLNDLFLGKVFPQFPQLLVADSRGRASYLVCKMNCCLVLFVEQLAAMIENQRTNLLVSNPNPLRRSGVSLGSIFTPIDDGRLEVGKFLVLLVQGARTGDGAI